MPNLYPGINPLYLFGCYDGTIVHTHSHQSVEAPRLQWAVLNKRPVEKRLKSYVDGMQQPAFFCATSRTLQAV